MRVRTVGEHAVLVECADADEVAAVHAQALARVSGADDIVPAALTVLIDGVGEPAALAEEVPAWPLEPVAAGAGPLVELSVRYGGPDLADVAELWGTSVEGAVARHTDREYVVAFCGFAPGFAYCRGLTQEEAVPRLGVPRTRVPAGSVAVANTWTGVYPTPSPGGWRLLGTTDATLWDLDREPPALLSPGTRVVFRDASSLGSSTQVFRDV